MRKISTLYDFGDIVIIYMYYIFCIYVWDILYQISQLYITRHILHICDEDLSNAWSL